MYVILTAKWYLKQLYTRFEFCILTQLMIINENLHFIFHCHDIYVYIYIHIYIMMYSLLIYLCIMYMMYYSIVIAHKYAGINLQTGELANAKLYCFIHSEETVINVFHFMTFGKIELNYYNT